jgi:hypothetical protein
MDCLKPYTFNISKKQRHELAIELNIKGKAQGYIGDNLHL